MGFLWAYYLLLKKWQRKRIHCFICVFAIFIIHDSWQICIPIYCIKWHKTYKEYTCKFNIIHPFPNIIKRHVWWKLCKMYTFTSIYVQGSHSKCIHLQASMFKGSHSKADLSNVHIVRCYTQIGLTIVKLWRMLFTFLDNLSFAQICLNVLYEDQAKGRMFVSKELWKHVVSV